MLTYFHFFFNATPTTEIYPLSLHDALPISSAAASAWTRRRLSCPRCRRRSAGASGSRSSASRPTRSEEHTSELQSQSNLVCRLLLEKKKQGGERCRRSEADSCTSG